MTPAQVGSSESCGIFKITCFEEHLLTTASIRCYFDTVSLKQSGLYTTYSFKILFSERKHRNNLKNYGYEKNILYNSHKYNVYVMFYYEILWFYLDFKSENLSF